MIFGRGYGRAGDELTWEWLNSILKLARGNRLNTGPNSGISLIRTEGVGTVIRLSDSGASGKQLAVTASTITAAVNNAGSCTDSGGLVKTTPGTGTVYPMAYNGTCLVADTTKPTISVLSFSTTTGGIGGGVNVWIEQNDNDGMWYVTSVDCGN